MFRRVFFGEDPADEHVDFSLYVEFGYGLILRTEAKALRGVHQQCGTPIPEWLRRASGAEQHRSVMP